MEAEKIFRRVNSYKRLPALIALQTLLITSENAFILKSD